MTVNYRKNKIENEFEVRKSEKINNIKISINVVWKEKYRFNHCKEFCFKISSID